MRGAGIAFRGGRRSWLRGGALALSLAAIVLTGMTTAPAAQAQNARPDFGQFKHRRWTADDGAPVGISGMIQTSDGYLWLLSDALYRFDGVTFERVAAPAGSPMERATPSTLMVSQAGELWVGFRDAVGIAVYRNGVLQDMRMPNPPRVIGRLTQTADGVIWASSGMYQGRLKRFAKGRWEHADDALGLPDGAVTGMEVTPNGNLWVVLSHRDGQTGSLAYLPPGATLFTKTPHRLSRQPRIKVDPNGALWVADRKGTRMLIDPAGKPPSPAILFPPVPDFRAADLAFDRAGGIWGTTQAAGIFHIPASATSRSGSGGQVRRFREVDGLTSDTTHAPFVDREGSVWIVTELGVDQFRPASALQEARITAEPTEGVAMAQAKDGRVYIAPRGTLFMAEPGQPARPLGPTGDVLALCTARDGGIWMIQTSRIVRVQAKRWVSEPSFPGDEPATSCAEDRLGRLWMVLMSGQLVWRDAKGSHHAQGDAGKARVWDMITTPSGDITFTTPGDLATIQGDRYALTKLAPFDIGLPTMIAAGARDVFVSGNGGLLRVRGDKVARLDGSRFPWVARLRSLVQTPRGETWMISRLAISRVSTADLDRAFDDPRAPLDRRLFDSNDGLSSAAQHAGFAGVQSVVGGDGRVWFLNREGAAFFDPARLQANTLAPPVAIRWLASGQKVYRDPQQIVLPPGTRSIEIAYAGLSLAVPQRVRFRYRLDGVDDHWVDPGARRLASYSNLRPGRYRFQVIAANDEGVWNKIGATLAFEVRPTFVQSWPFKALCAVALAGILWLAYRLRMRVVTNRIRMRMATRVEERERIARELHDTLLQSVQSLTLRFQLAVDDLPKKAPARPALVAAIDRADEVIAQGRDRVRELRSSHNERDIGAIIADIVARQAFAPEVVVAMETDGAPRALDPLTLDEVGQIASEAIFNIWRHAHAGRITIETSYGADFCLRIADDGAGIDPEIAESGKDGHFGVSGMRERASKLRGELRVRRVPTGGAEVMLTIPGEIAYAPERRRRLAPLESRW